MDSSIRKRVRFGYRLHSDGENWKKRDPFWCKNGVKKAHYTYNWSSSHFHFLPLFKPSFFRLTGRIWRVEDNENKRAERKERKKARKNNRKGPAQKKRSKFWLDMHQIKILYIFVPNPQGNLPFCKKSLFIKFKALLVSWQPKIGYNG